MDDSGREDPPTLKRLRGKTKAFRRGVLSRDGYVCQTCGGNYAGKTRGLHAHHIKSFSDYPDLRYVVDNGVTLCRSCHLHLHGQNPRPGKPIPCGCGCGRLILSVDKWNSPRRFVCGHQSVGKPLSIAHLAAHARLGPLLKGRPLSPEHRAAVAESNRRPGKKNGPGAHWANQYMTEQEFVAAFPLTKTSDIAETCRVTVTAVNRWAKKRGLVKDPNYIHAAYRKSPEHRARISEGRMRAIQDSTPA